MRISVFQKGLYQRRLVLYRLRGAGKNFYALLQRDLDGPLIGDNYLYKSALARAKAGGNLSDFHGAERADKRKFLFTGELINKFEFVVSRQSACLDLPACMRPYTCATGQHRGESRLALPRRHFWLRKQNARIIIANNARSEVTMMPILFACANCNPWLNGVPFLEPGEASYAPD
jgi:hypothetical protein